MTFRHAHRRHASPRRGHNIFATASWRGPARAEWTGPRGRGWRLTVPPLVRSGGHIAHHIPRQRPSLVLCLARCHYFQLAFLRPTPPHHAAPRAWRLPHTVVLHGHSRAFPPPNALLSGPVRRTGAPSPHPRPPTSLPTDCVWLLLATPPHDSYLPAARKEEANMDSVGMVRTPDARVPPGEHRRVTALALNSTR